MIIYVYIAIADRATIATIHIWHKKVYLNKIVVVLDVPPK